MSAENHTERKVDYHDFHALRQDVLDMKSLMARMVEAMGRISVIEDRQHATAQALNKLVERMEQIVSRQHQQELDAVATQGLATRVEAIERLHREIHIENERQKARFQTVVWMVRGLWAIAAAGGITLGAKFLAPPTMPPHVQVTPTTVTSTK